MDISDGDWAGEKKFTDDTDPSRPLIDGGCGGGGGGGSGGGSDGGGGGGGLIGGGSSPDQVMRCLERLWSDSVGSRLCCGGSVESLAREPV